MLLTLPVLIPLFAAMLLFFMRKLPSAVTWLSGVTAFSSLLVASLLMYSVSESGIQAVSFGSWAAPFGIVFVADLLSAAMVLITAIIGVAITTYTYADLRDHPSYTLYHVLIHMLLTAVSGAFLTGDLFNLYVWFEVMLITSFGLMVLGAAKEQITGAMAYVVLNLISTLVFLLAIGLSYGSTGTLNLADLHQKMPLVPVSITAMLAGLLFFAFSIKSALFPVFTWLPRSYHTMPSAIVALFAALLTKVGVYVFIRLFTLVFPLKELGMQPLFMWVAGLTMVTGVLGAACQFSIKRILSFHIISQIGYMMMGLALYTPLAIAGAIFYVIHHIIVKANLFLIGGVLERTHQSDGLERLGGAYKAMPYLALLFIIPAFSLAGFPPLSGFWGKFVLIKASITLGDYLLAATALIVGLLTIYSMSKIWAEAFWKKAPKGQKTVMLTLPQKLCYYGPILLLALLTMIIGIAVEPFFQLAEQAAISLLEPSDYIHAVLKP